MYSLSKKRDQRHRDEAYIDFNGQVTDELIYKDREAGGYDWISQKLINLLKRHDANALIPIKTERYPEYSQKDVQNHYKQSTYKEVEVKKDGEFEIPLGNKNSLDLLIYKVSLPLRYIAQELINSHNLSHNNNYHLLTSKEIIGEFSRHNEEIKEKNQGDNPKAFMGGLIITQ